MSARYQVVWSDEARDDAATIWEYLQERAPASADAFLDDVERAADSLERLPDRGRWVPEMERITVPSLVPRYRELILAPWRLIYLVDGSTVRVVTVVDGRRNIMLALKRLGARL